MKAMCWKWHQMSALAEQSGGGAVKPRLIRSVMKTDARASTKEHGDNLNFSNRPVRTRMGGVQGRGCEVSPIPIPEVRAGCRDPFRDLLA